MIVIKCAAAVILLALSSTAGQSGRPSGTYLKQAELNETDGTIHVVVNSPRPLAQTLEALYQKYRWAIDYEDPQFLSKLDLTESPIPGPSPSKQIVPSGQQFKFEFASSNVDEGKILQAVIDAYNASENPGRFELRKGEEDTYFVVGTQAHDLKGAISPQRPLLDSPVTIVKRQRTVADALSLICQKVGEHDHIKVMVGILPRNLVERTQVEVGGTRVPARTLLLQALAALHRRVYWRLLFDPSTKGYVFDVHAIPA